MNSPNPCFAADPEENEKRDQEAADRARSPPLAALMRTIVGTQKPIHKGAGDVIAVGQHCMHKEDACSRRKLSCVVPLFSYRDWAITERLPGLGLCLKEKDVEVLQSIRTEKNVQSCWKICTGSSKTEALVSSLIHLRNLIKAKRMRDMLTVENHAGVVANVVQQTREMLEHRTETTRVIVCFTRHPLGYPTIEYCDQTESYFHRQFCGRNSLFSKSKILDGSLPICMHWFGCWIEIARTASKALIRINAAASSAEWNMWVEILWLQRMKAEYNRNLVIQIYGQTPDWYEATFGQPQALAEDPAGAVTLQQHQFEGLCMWAHEELARTSEKDVNLEERLWKVWEAASSACRDDGPHTTSGARRRRFVE